MSDFITNAELRIEAERLCDENERLQNENAKLRELVADFVRQMRLAGCFDCFGGSCEKWGECHGDCVLERRARELGVLDDYRKGMKRKRLKK